MRKILEIDFCFLINRIKEKYNRIAVKIQTLHSGSKVGSLSTTNDESVSISMAHATAQTQKTSIEKRPPVKVTISSRNLCSRFGGLTFGALSESIKSWVSVPTNIHVLFVR